MPLFAVVTGIVGWVSDALGIGLTVAESAGSAWLRHSANSKT
jgi:hypothetical protein